MKLQGLDFRRVEFGSAAYQEMVALRIEILRRPLGLAHEGPDPTLEPKCIHLAAFHGDSVVGTLVLEPVDSTTLKMRQVATRGDLRRRGIASGLVGFAEGFARAAGHVRLIAHARETAVEFYRKLGYEIGDTTFLEVTLPHRHIAKKL
jgi:GNAT superfamily N-acetyltransferase